MITRLTPHFVNLTYEAALKSFWRKEALKRFLRNCDVPETLISSWGEGETKRQFLDRLFDELNNHLKREEILAKMARSLIDQNSFPDLEGWEDSTEKTADAKQAISNLRSYVEEQEEELENKRRQAETRQKFHRLQQKARRAQQDLEVLSNCLNGLVAEIGTQNGGYKFQDWFFDLMEYFDVIARRPYSHGGRQIDGSITLKDTTYLIELKFTSSQSDATDIDSFIRKITTKADNTMGIFVSMSGYSSVAIQEASGDKTPVILIDYNHIYHILGGRMSFPDMIDRIRRHASQTGEAYLPISKFSN